MIQIQCGICQRKLKAPLTAAGKNVRCTFGEKILVSTPSNGPESRGVSEKPIAIASGGFAQNGVELVFPLSFVAEAVKAFVAPFETLDEFRYLNSTIQRHSALPTVVKAVDTPVMFVLGLVALVRGLFDGD